MLTPNEVLASQEFDRSATEIARVGRFLAEQGWSPASSSNYSTKLTDDWIAITRSEVNKYEINPADIMIVDSKGAPKAPENYRPSAETLIHTAIYQCRPQARAVLHTHSPENTRLSLRFFNEGSITFEGYEMQKGFIGVSTHENKIEIPILANAQDMTFFSGEVVKLLTAKPEVYAFLIAGHGLYTWSRDIKATQRQVETCEFLFKCKALEMMGV